MALKYQLLLIDLCQCSLALLPLQLSAAYGASTDSWAAWLDLKKSESSTDFKNRVRKLRQLVLLSHRNRSGGGQRGLGVCIERIRTSYEGKKIGLHISSPLTHGCVPWVWHGTVISTVSDEMWERCSFPPGCQHCVHSLQPSNWWVFSPWLLFWVSCYQTPYSPPSRVGTLWSQWLARQMSWVRVFTVPRQKLWFGIMQIWFNLDCRKEEDHWDFIILVKNHLHESLGFS